jgi:hypothetical protein
VNEEFASLDPLEARRPEDSWLYQASSGKHLIRAVHAAKCGTDNAKKKSQNTELSSQSNSCWRKARCSLLENIFSFYA